MLIRRIFIGVGAGALLGGLLIGPGAVAAPDDGPVEAGITVPKVEGMGPDWINGVDVSSILSLEESGVTFKNADGQEADLFTVLAEHDVNWVRVRVWNEPYSSADSSHGYGAGNVDADRATEIAKRATQAGMRILVNFHYSDFWAHPGQQKSPRAWRGMSLTERADALYEYTADTLEKMRAAGVDVAMVQIGNETTNGEIAGETGWGNTGTLFRAGSEAVRDTLGSDVLVAVHFTNPERAGQYLSAAQQLQDHGVDYDVFLSSYYAFWHGSLENLTAVLSQVATTYDKDVAVAETSWVYTLEDGDGYPNSVDSTPSQYSASVQGQALAVRDVMQAVADVDGGRGLGTFYWEPAWLPVGPPEEYDDNWDLWQRDGSGWASTYSQEFYDPDGNLGGSDAEPYGGSSWDNQAMFDFQGHPLESLRVYEYARTGSVAERSVDRIIVEDIAVTTPAEVTLPPTVVVAYTDSTTEEVPVRWDQDPAWILDDGVYTFTATTGAGIARLQVTVRAESAGGKNYVENPGFEDGADPWTGAGTGYTIGATDDPHSGAHSTHFWADAAYGFSIEQTLTGIPPGEYVLSAKAQGGDAGAGDTLEISAQSGISTVRAPFALAGYENWQTPRTEPITVGADGTVTVRADLSLSAGAWGTLDDFEFVSVAQKAEADTRLLHELATTAREVDLDRYTQASASALKTALTRAEQMLSGEAGQASIDGAVAALQAALDELEELPEGPGPTGPPEGEPDPTPGPDDSEPPAETPGPSALPAMPGSDDSDEDLSRTGVGPVGTIALVSAAAMLLGALALSWRHVRSRRG